MTDTDYVSYPLALALKKAGFDEPCDKWIASKSFSYYDEDECCDHNAVIRKGWIISQKQKERYDQEALPHLTLWQAQKWLRERKKLHCQVLLNGVRSMYFWQVRELVGNGKHAESKHQYEIYEDAMNDCIAAALELIEEKGV